MLQQCLLRGAGGVDSARKVSSAVAVAAPPRTAVMGKGVRNYVENITYMPVPLI